MHHQLPPSLTDARWCTQQAQQPPPTVAQQNQQRGNTQRGGLGQQTPRYPNPIQRPAVYTPQSGGMQQNMSVRPPRLPATQRATGAPNKLYNAQGECSLLSRGFSYGLHKSQFF
jgi:hypothetical protein